MGDAPFLTNVVSAASAWEMAIKVRLGRLPAASDITRNFQEYLTQSGFESLSVSAEPGIRAGLLPGPQRDPFDRMLIAQAEIEKLFVVSDERILDQWGAPSLVRCCPRPIIPFGPWISHPWSQ